MPRFSSSRIRLASVNLAAGLVFFVVSVPVSAVAFVPGFGRDGIGRRGRALHPASGQFLARGVGERPGNQITAKAIQHPPPFLCGTKPISMERGLESAARMAASVISA